MLKINATDLPRFMACNGSRLMPGANPALADTNARDEGNAAHYMATALYTGQHSLEELTDRKAPNGVFMTGEMAEHVAAYQQIWFKNHTLIGMEFDTSHDNSPTWVVDGRGDFIGLYTEQELHIIDFKYGWRIVEPEMNWTLISHAIGFLKQKQFTPATIRFSIFQPRPHHPDGPMRSWVITHTNLLDLWVLVNAALCAPSDELTTSPHCAKCPAIVPCPAARLAEMNSIDAIDTIYQDTITNEMLSFTLDNLNRAQDMLNERLKAFEELAKHRIKSGQVVNNYSVGIGYGHNKFKEGMTVEMLQMLTGKDLSKPGIVTPAEAKRRGVNETILATITERPMTGVKLERITASKKAARLLK